MDLRAVQELVEDKDSLVCVLIGVCLLWGAVLLLV